MRIENTRRFTPANLGKPHSDRVVRSVFAYGRRHEAIQTALCNRVPPPGSAYPESTIVEV